MKKLILLSAIVLFQVALFAQTTYIYFENSTSLDFSVNSTQTGAHTMETDEWWYSTADISAWQDETNVLYTNRNSGIHWGDDFYLTTTLSSGAFSIDLKLKLHGDFVGSTIWSAAAGPGFSHGWTSDNNFHSEIFNIGGKQYQLKYTFYFTGGADDILYTLHEYGAFSADVAELTNPDIMNVLAYNTYMLTPPIALSDQGTRAQHIDDAVHDLDAILIQEVFDNSARATLLAELAPEYPYQTAVVDLPNILEDGGIMIASRWPIEYSEQMVWNDCNTPDCLANKGVMYARINKLGRKYHLFSTHQQAFNGTDDVAARNLQMQQFSAFIDAQNIPADEAVIFGGDMNVDKYTNKQGEYDNMFTIFNSTEPTYSGHPYTWDKYSNHYINLGSEAPEYLDYVLADNDYLVPTSQSNSVWILRSNHDDMWNIHDLSDHFGIHGRFVYPAPVDPCDLTVITIGSTVTDESVQGANDGSIDITVGGGLAPYTFSWSNGGTTEDISGLAPGSYTVDVTDANGCTENGNATVAAGADPCATTVINISGNVSDENGAGGNDGSIDITVGGGLAPYTFSWSNGASTEDLTGLAGGTYTVDVMDANGCAGNAGFTVETTITCFPTTGNFSDNPLTHTRAGSSTSTVNLDAGGSDASFVISGINQVISGKRNKKYIELVTVTYVDGNGATQTYGSYSGANVSSANISISGEVQSITLELEDIYDGETRSNMSVSMTAVDYCGAPPCADADGDGVCDDDDACPGIDDGLIGTSCDDGIDCTEGDVYNSNCNCAGTYADTDGDGVCDADDICPGGDDNIDLDGNGTPDFCDSPGCTATTGTFSTNPLTHRGSGSSSTTINLPSNSQDVDFTVSNIGQVTGGKVRNRYIESVTITYVDGGGNSQTFGTFNAAGSVNVSIPGSVQSVTVSLTDAYDGNSNKTMSVNMSDVSYCGIAARFARTTIMESNINLYPNPVMDVLNVSYQLEDANSAVISVYAIDGQEVARQLVNNPVRTELDVSDLTGGIYILQLVDGNGTSQTIKFVKQ
ncbi:MAG: T9SS type A sorting domain-containing protein [Bacteroidetes bacterium]|nr:T9SS type A sorting domain-containing protein [Bacteroidota bacterium]